MDISSFRVVGIYCDLNTSGLGITTHLTMKGVLEKVQSHFHEFTFSQRDSHIKLGYRFNHNSRKPVFASHRPSEGNREINAYLQVPQKTPAPIWDFAITLCYRLGGRDTFTELTVYPPQFDSEKLQDIIDRDSRPWASQIKITQVKIDIRPVAKVLNYNGLASLVEGFKSNSPAN